MSTCFPLFLTKPTVSGFDIPSLLLFVFLSSLMLHTFQLFLIFCPLVPFHIPLAKVAKKTKKQKTKNFGQAGNRKPDSFDKWAKPEVTAEQSRPRGSSIATATPKKVEAESKWQNHPCCLFTHRDIIWGSLGKTTVMYTSLWVGAKYWQPIHVILWQWVWLGDYTSRDCFNYKWEKETWKSLS